MKSLQSLSATFVALLAITLLAACGDTADEPEASNPGDSGYGAPPAMDDDSPGADSSPMLTTAETSLGTIVVDGEGRVVYQFDSDEQGSKMSTCEGQCAQMWPPVSGAEIPELDGVTGEVEMIAGVDGQPQVTLNGWPLYYFAGDSAAGDTTGQGVGGVWWVLTPEGEPIRD